MSCMELFRGDRFIVSEMPPDSSSRVASSLKQARNIRLQEISEENQVWMAKYVKGRRFPKCGSGQDTDVIGLAGEIVCEMYHIECEHQCLFYAKWKESGTSKSNGVDLLVEDAGRLLAVECKHAHSPQSTGKESGLLRAIKTGMMEHSDQRTRGFLTERYRVMIKRARQLDAEGSDAAQTLRKARVLKSALVGGFDSQVDLAADKNRAGAVDFARLGSRVAAIQPARQSALLLVGGLHEITEAA